MEEPMLRLSDVTMPFKLHTDASEFAIEGVLMQDGHPIAIESRKLNETEKRYTVQEKEMTVVVYCLRIWRHYLLGSRFVINTDNIAMSYFQNQKKLSPKQAGWQDFLAEFDYQLEYKPRKANVLKGDMLFTKGDRLYVPKWDDLKQVILKECHDSKWAGYPGSKRMLALVEGTYYWPRMEDDVETFILYHMVGEVRREWKYYSGGGPILKGAFWSELFKIMGTDLNFSMSFHPQTHGQTERVNALLEFYLRHYGAAKAASGVKLGAAAAAVTAAAGATMSGSKQDAKQASK
ncbi:putative nucleotidyltransferase, ribonuclease H [Tanacetum coccineum]